MSFSALLLAALLSWPAGAQAIARDEASPSQSAPAAPPTRPDVAAPAGLQAAPPQAEQASYIIGPQDSLTISVLGEDDISGKYRVDEGGGIAFPYVGRVQAAGLTIADFQARLEALLEAGYIRHPQIRVDIDQYKSQQVFVMGEVRSPGKITLTGTTMTLLEALAQAGSLTPSASNDVTVIHPTRRTTAGVPSESDMEGERIHVNMKDLVAVNSVLLRDGDIITVAKAQQFYIQGYVRNAGSFILDGSLTLEQAVALAGGLTDRGTFRGAAASRLVDGKLTDVKLDRTDKVLPGDTVTIKQRLF
ncbi:MAG: polysaccharide biosynthesis/export family protein [Acidobacteria bacterium]|nr:polysaccharide biosynthesis/export family protein [Acidobacteriota bacterium]